MDMIGRIRRLHGRKNKSEREIARMTELSRNTVAKNLSVNSKLSIRAIRAAASAASERTDGDQAN